MTEPAPRCLFCGRLVPEKLRYAASGQLVSRPFCCHNHEQRQQTAIRKLRKTSPAEAIA